MVRNYRLLLALLGILVGAASCSSTQVIEIESRLSPDGQYRATLKVRTRNAAKLFVVVLARPDERPEPLGVFQVFVPIDSDIERLAKEQAVSVRWESPAILRVSYEEWLKPHLMYVSWEGVSIVYEKRPGVRR
jgi:hypothetical protein